MSSLLFIIMLAYTLVWFSINIYNIFPLINYYIVGRRKEDKPDYVLPKDLPSISILIPAYREELVLGNCISRIFESDYPTELLDVIILTERDDQGTMAIAHELSKKYGIKHVQVEESTEPKGKPRALNFGLRHVRGDIVGVIDAEDIIAKELFREVALMMSSGYDAVQGVLDMVNDRDGYMNMHLRAEYRYWYHTYLPALQYSNFPIPLGGTTNFFRRSVLKDLEGWDPYNVTEDFELGLRLYNERKRVGNIYDMLKDRRAQSIFRNNYKFSLLESVTQEESPTTMSGWLRQRTRWQRGKIQTFRKIAKKPPQAATSKLHSIMMSLIPHLGPINLTGIAYSLYIFFSGISIPVYLYYIFGFNMSMIAFYCVANAYSYFNVVGRTRNRRFLGAIFIGITTLVYWVMQWMADVRAIKHEYIGSKVFWEKTDHSGVHMKG